MAEFLAESVEVTDRVTYNGSVGPKGQIVYVTVKLVSSGDTSKTPDCEIEASVLSKLRHV